LFDLDGTLVDSAESIARCWLRWADEYGVDPMRLVDAHGRTSAQIVADLVGPDAVGAALRRIDALEIDDAHTVTAMPGALELLDSLPDGRWTVVTSGNAALADARMRAAGIRPPADLVTADDVTRGKPDPEPYLLGAGHLGLDPADCVVVEDAPTGITSARAAGMRVVAVSSTYGPERLTADLVVSGPAALTVRGRGPLVISEAGW
jgi:sugar-phosphatase